MWWLILALGAGAYESDQLTDREVPLADSTDRANAVLNQLLAEAAARTNRRTRCQADFDRTHHELARAIKVVTARGAMVFQRGLFRAPGFTTYSALMETDPEVVRRDWMVREDVYADVTLWQSVILTLAGPSSTVAVDGELVGTDKFDHFLNFGHRAWKLSRNGRFPERVEEFDRRSERYFFGLLTSKTYSYGDIAANNDGYEFFRGLLHEDSVLRLEDGCVVLDEPFDWGEYVDWRYDEALNPPLHTRLVQKRVDVRIEREPERYCRAWEALGPHYEEHLAALFERTTAPPVPWVHGRIDPWGLAALCADGGGG